MTQCVCERDYMEYVEGRLSPSRLMQLRLHAMGCPACRADLAGWPVLRRMVRRAERQGAGRKVGMSETVMARIRRLEASH